MLTAAADLRAKGRPAARPVHSDRIVVPIQQPYGRRARVAAAPFWAREATTHKERASPGLGRESPRRVPLPQCLYASPRRLRSAEARMRVEEEPRSAAERDGPGEECHRLGFASTAEARILSEHSQVIGHSGTVSGNIA